MEGGVAVADELRDLWDRFGSGKSQEGISIEMVREAVRLLRKHRIPPAVCLRCRGEFLVLAGPKERPYAPEGMNPLVICEDCEHAIECHGATS